jgi:hypothetical protein
MPNRTIICADALPWMRAGESGPCSVVTSPPEAAELNCSVDEWRSFYVEACRLCFTLLADDAPAVVYSTDRKINGGWISKPHLMMLAAEAAGVRMLWHKIVLRREPGQCDVHRPGYTHMVAFGGPKCRPGAVSPDVLRRGFMTYPDAMGLYAAEAACAFAGRKGLPLLDPFCGRGTVPAVANRLGFDSIGVDISPEQCGHARTLNFTQEWKVAAE